MIEDERSELGGEAIRVLGADGGGEEGVPQQSLDRLACLPPRAVLGEVMEMIWSVAAGLESFFHMHKVERIHHLIYPTRDAARRDLFGYIEGFYTSRRLNSALGYRSPADAELMVA